MRSRREALTRGTRSRARSSAWRICVLQTPAWIVAGILTELSLLSLGDKGAITSLVQLPGGQGVWIKTFTCAGPRGPDVRRLLPALSCTSTVRPTLGPGAVHPKEKDSPQSGLGQGKWRQGWDRTAPPFPGIQPSVKMKDTGRNFFFN